MKFYAHLEAIFGTANPNKNQTIFPTYTTRKAFLGQWWKIVNILNTNILCICTVNIVAV